MNPVITEDDARKITGGRKPLVPVEYETALRELVACTNLDEAKHWSDKSDALAAWAKMYHDDKVGRQARALKLHAFDRLGSLARELRPNKAGARIAADGTRIRGGSMPGSSALLEDKGLSRESAQAAIRISKLPREIFAAAVAAPVPPTPHSFKSRVAKDSTEAWRQLIGVNRASGFAGFHSLCRNSDAAEMARGLSEAESAKVKEMLTIVLEWLDRFEHHLPKQRRGK